ncbi:unnamed protein product, partial [Prorocentrum cordatum]
EAIAATTGVAATVAAGATTAAVAYAAARVLAATTLVMSVVAATLRTTHKPPLQRHPHSTHYHSNYMLLARASPGSRLQPPAPDAFWCFPFAPLLLPLQFLPLPAAPSSLLLPCSLFRSSPRPKRSPSRCSLRAWAFSLQRFGMSWFPVGFALSPPVGIPFVLPVPSHERHAFSISPDHGKASLLFLVVVAVMLVDIAFAVDSVASKIASVNDVFLNCSSSAFAMLSLRSLYFVVESLTRTFQMLKYGVAAILILIGLKLIFAGVIPVSNEACFAAVLGILVASVASSYWVPQFRGSCDRINLGAIAPITEADDEDEDQELFDRKPEEADVDSPGAGDDGERVMAGRPQSFGGHGAL